MVVGTVLIKKSVMKMKIKDAIIKLCKGYTADEFNALTSEYLVTSKERDILEKSLDNSKFNYTNARTALKLIEDRMDENVKQNYNSFVPIKKYKQAKQDGYNFYRLYHNFIHELIEEQIEYYQELNFYNGTDIKGLIKQYIMLDFEYLKDVVEYFSSASELIYNRIDNNGILKDDCDGRALDMYYFLKANDCKDEYKLQVVDTILERHMNLIFWNTEVKDWCVIESTIWSRDWERMFNNPARYQNYAKPVVVFDEKSEYRTTWGE